MRAAWGLILVLSASGCATPGMVQSYRQSDPFPATSSAPPFPQEDSSPKLILPAGGGPPVMAIPLGAGVYLPLTADPPTAGIPLTP